MFSSLLQKTEKTFKILITIAREIRHKRKNTHIHILETIAKCFKEKNKEKRKTRKKKTADKNQQTHAFL